MTAHEDAVRDLARDLDARWPSMHADGAPYEFGPITAGLVEREVPPFAPAEDAHEAAWTRETYSRALVNERRNESERVRSLRVKEAFALLDRTEQGRDACRSLLVFSVWECGQIEQLADMPTLRVSVR